MKPFSPSLRLRWPSWLWLLAFICLCTSLAPTAQAQSPHRWGVGTHFWKTVDDLADDGFDDIEDEGFAYVFSYQYDPGSLMKFEVDLEYYDGGFAGSPNSSLTPVGYVIIGGKIYGALGIGITYSSGLQDDFSDPFFAVRVGYVLTLLPKIRIDINANYRAGAFNDLDEADTDAITLGAIVRF
ncbi:MAG: outer membrane beta-barrel protein [Acidobacteriota bacterium]